MFLWEAGSANTFKGRTNWQPNGATHRGQIYSKYALLRAAKLRYQGGKQDGEEAEVGKVSPGQVVVLSLGHVKLTADIMLGVHPALLGVANVGSPGLLPRGYEGELFVTLQAVKSIDLADEAALPWFVSVAVLV